MRGLIIKDYLLMKNQMKLLILFLIIALIMAMNLGDSMFIISYITFVTVTYTQLRANEKGRRGVWRLRGDKKWGG
ncbi:MAG: ABC-2 transporter permease, partial [Lachnospiraceae bacterium]|nr:ABC-2 transporter permease [Lachnospiraceae bacterium]